MGGNWKTETAEGSAGLPPAGLLERLRGAGRDPFHRAEARQTSLGMHVVAVALCLACPPAVFFLPAVLAAEAVYADRSRGTLMALLLTPADRRRFLWAKVLARGQAFFLLAQILTGLGTGLGALVAVGAEGLGKPAWLWGGLVGLGLGATAGLLVAAEALTAGAVGIYFGLRFGRVAAFLLAFLALAGFHALELSLTGLLAAVAWNACQLLSTAAGWAAVALVIAARTALTGLVLPDGLLAHCAVHFDRWMLKRELDA